MAMRPTWKGSVSFGLVSIGVKMYGATQNKDVSFHQVHRSDGGRIRYRKFCEVEEKEVPSEQIAKAYDLGGGNLVLMEDDDFAHLPVPSTHTIEVAEFVPQNQIDPIYYAKSYFLEPERPVKPYLLFRDSLVKAGVVAVVKITMRQREQVATLRPKGELLVLHTMHWPDEVRQPEFENLHDPIKLSTQEISMAQQLISSMTVEDLDLTEFTDEYRKALEQVIEAKAEGRQIVEAPEAAEGGKVLDLMAALEASVKAKTDKEPAKKTAKKTTRKRKAS